MEFRIDIQLQVEDQADGLGTAVPINVQILYRAGRWQAQCLEPPCSTVLCDSMEEAVVQAAKEVTREFASR